MGLFSGLRDRLVGFMQGVINDAYTVRANDILSRREYRYGLQKRQLKPSRNFDDNVVMNFTGLSIDRGVSMLFGQEVEFEFEKEGGAEETVETSPQEDYIHEVWEANNKPILLHDTADDGATAGTCFIKIKPDGVAHNGKLYPKLINIDPYFMDLGCDPYDMDRITRYTIQYKTIEDDGKEVGRREITQWTQTNETDTSVGYWLITHEITNSSGKWIDDLSIAPVAWEWEFAPIVHWKNLPYPHSLYGMPDVTPDVVELQDRLNFVASNMSKIIRLYAHPFRWSRFFGNEPGTIKVGPDDMPNSNNDKAEIIQLAPVADLETSRLFGLNLRQSLFDITRTVDITSIADKLGTLTNFGLHVLYQDAMAKLETKRSLYGWGLGEINRRLMILANMDTLETEVVWANPLPENLAETMQSDQGQLGMGIVSKRTISERAGYDYEKEQARIEDEKAGQDNLGNALLNAFNKGQDNTPPMMQPAAKMPAQQMTMDKYGNPISKTPGGAQ